MKRVLLSVALALALGAMMQAQNNSSQSSTSTSTQASTQNETNDNATHKNWGAGHPQGTKVTEHESDTVVQPKNAPVKINAKVVRSAQQQLNQDGYNAGPVDGVVGPQTRAALQKFQSSQNLPQTGRLDQKTMAALNVGGVQELEAAPRDLGRAGKAIGHDTVAGHPIEAGKAAVTGSKDFGKKVGEGTESEAMKIKDKVGSGISSVGKKVEGAGNKTKNAGQATEQKPTDQNTTNTNNPPKR